MKELSIEEKAKRYDEGLKEAVIAHKDEDRHLKATLERIFPELKESEDEKIRKKIIQLVNDAMATNAPYKKEMLAWLDKQGEQKPTQEVKPFEAEHGKYYYCIKDYFCGGRKQASKGDVVQALRGLPIMGLKDASEYFLPVNFIKCYSTWSEEDEYIIEEIEAIIDAYVLEENNPKALIDWLKSLRPQNRWKPSERQKEALLWCVVHLGGADKQTLGELLEELNKL